MEFLYYLKKYRYNDYLTSDTSPTRWDIKGTFEANSRMSNKIWQKLDEIDGGKIAKLMAKGDYLETWRFIERRIFFRLEIEWIFSPFPHLDSLL